MPRCAARSRTAFERDQGDERRRHLHRVDDRGDENTGGRPLNATAVRSDRVHRADGGRESSVTRSNLQRRLIYFAGRIQSIDERATLEWMEYNSEQREIPG